MIGYPSTAPFATMPPRAGMTASGLRRAAGPARPLRMALVGNALPRRCGIATFTTDLEHALRALPQVGETAIVAMTDPGGHYAYPLKVRQVIHQNQREDYRAAAAFINAQGYDAVCLQHEFGIFGGEAGAYVLDLIDALQVPLVTTLHTVLDKPNPAQEHVMARVLAASARVVVMARKGRDILIAHYGVDPARIAIIPHGIHDVPWEPSAPAKRRLGFEGRQVILTFGLIGPSKGIETMVEAMPAILERAPHAVYIVMGATHPHLLRSGRDSYREALVARIKALGIEDHVQFIDRFVDQAELLEHIALCDVYVTPYVEEAQMTSGTLATSHGLGRPVVATPYWHAAELLGDGSGVLVPFGDGAALGAAVADLLGDDRARLALSLKAYTASRAMTWPNTALRYAQAFRAVRRVTPVLPAPLVTAGSLAPERQRLASSSIQVICDGATSACR